MIAAPGYATTHIYRSPFPRSSSIVNLRAERIAEADKNAPAIITMTRPRGYLDPARDKMAFDGQTAAARRPCRAPASPARRSSRPACLATVTAEFNGERVTGRTWPAAENHLSILELTY